MQDTPPPAAGRPDRLDEVDALRGFALAGILAVNVWAFADPYLGTLTPNPSYGALDHALRFVIALFFEGKFYLLFSFLFGLSVQLQAEAAERAGADDRQRMKRRHRALLALGLLHALLLFEGDILMLYALLGGALMRRHHWTVRRSVRVAVGLVVVSGLAWLLAGLLVPATPANAAAATSPEALRLRAAYGGSALETLRMRCSQLPMVLTGELLLQGPSAFAMFLLGRSAGRRGLFADLALLRTRLRRALPFALPLGLGGAVFYAVTTAPGHGFGVELVSLGTMILAGPLLSACYLAGMLALFARPGGERLVAALAPLGRMALTNYLSQSLLLGLIFTGYGLALIDRLPVAGVIALLPPIIGGQMVFSRWWLARHPYGPVEWMLRAATIGRRPPWRHAPQNRRSALT
ncbi:DUF418 domain-containing protein [Aquabacterium humicola]|uniref:DUF418 domain-containing protein n=1 Tax=Aquabacterium humicola TaxID=3237377 RepID=UPI002543D139|nr:DUF418 domain-containing protein [Rubrivivax pictus]